MGRKPSVSRRQVVRTLPVALTSLAGCNLNGDSSNTTATTDAPAGPSPTAAALQTHSPTDARSPTPDGESTVTPDLASRLRDVAVPLESVDPTADLSDLDPLRETLADARIVGMGEATHGTREFFRMKHRLLRYMVEELGFRVFAWEANFSETLMIDEYVTGGDVDPAAALNNVYFWTWDTQAVLSMLEWLRSFNEGRAPEDQVRFYGFDVQYARGPARRLIDYFETVDPEYLESIRTELETIAEEWLWGAEANANENVLEAVEQVAPAIEDRLEAHREDYVETTSESEWELANRHNWTMDQARALVEEETTGTEVDALGLRDEGMAANVSWLLEHTDADRIALWGHNSHVSRGTIPTSSAEWMGEHLDQEYGEEYYPLAFDFGRGSFRAYSRESEELTEFTIDEPPAGTISETFDEVGYDQFALDFTAIEDESLLDEFDVNYGIHGIGSAYDPDWGMTTVHHRQNLPEKWDGLVFVAETTATIPVEDTTASATPTQTPTPEN